MAIFGGLLVKIGVCTATAIVGLLTAGTPSLADSVTLTMDEVPNQPINGLSVTKGFETFTFSDRRGNLSYDSTGPGTLTFVQDPSIQGAAEPFSVTFSVPVSFLQFGLAEDSSTPLYGVEVLGSDGSVHSFDLTLTDPFAVR